MITWDGTRTTCDSSNFEDSLGLVHYFKSLFCLNLFIFKQSTEIFCDFFFIHKEGIWNSFFLKKEKVVLQKISYNLESVLKDQEQALEVGNTVSSR